MIVMRRFPNIPNNFRWPAFSVLFIFSIFILSAEIDKNNLEAASANSGETKVEHAEVIDEEEKDKNQDYREDPVSYLAIESFTSGAEGFGTVLVIDFKIRNSASISYKDIVVSCSQLGASGSKIATREETIYDSIPANELKSFSKISMGFINQQTKSISCVITGAKIY